MTDTAEGFLAAAQSDEAVSDPARARVLLSWTATVGLHEGLERTIAWMETNRHRFRTGEYVT